MKIKYIQLFIKLNYHFKDVNLLQQALTHRSVSSENNERLEFLGDALVNVIIAEALFKKYPHVKEGQLSRMRSSLVKGETLAEMAKELQLGDILRLGPGELKSGGFRRISILADAFEAVIAAIYLDSDFQTCERSVLKLFDERLHHEKLENNSKDAKTRLQEYVQAHKLGLPNYTVKKVTGEAHEQTFYVHCDVDGIEAQTDGVGSTRRRAEQIAADRLLNCLQSNEHNDE